MSLFYFCKILCFKVHIVLMTADYYFLFIFRLQAFRESQDTEIPLKLCFDFEKCYVMSYLTLVCLFLLRCPEEAADSLCADDEDLQRVVESLGLLPRLESCFLTVPFLCGFPHSLLSSSGGKVPALTTCSGLKA